MDGIKKTVIHSSIFLTSGTGPVTHGNLLVVSPRYRIGPISQIATFTLPLVSKWTTISCIIMPN